MRGSIFVVLLSLIVTAASAEPAGEAAVEARIKATLEQRYPNTTIEAVHASTTIAGWYEVVTATDIAYSDAKAELLLVGSLTDTRSKENLSARRWEQLHAIDFKSLPFDRAIKVVKGDGSRKLAVFADPDCPYCRKLEQELQGFPNLTVYIFLFPIAELHPDANRHAEQIWCAADAATSWASWVLEQKAPVEAKCASTPIAELAALGARLKITGTPTMFTVDGNRVVGAIDKDELERRLTEASAATRVAAAE